MKIKDNFILVKTKYINMIMKKIYIIFNLMMMIRKIIIVRILIL